MNAGVTDRLSARLQTARIGFDSQPRPMMIYNTMSGKKEPFRLMHKNRLNIFVCGPTVYDNSHIGHARTYIAFDVVARYLKYKGFSVFYLQNITDVDDKIIQRATELEIEPYVLARKFERRYLEDMQALGVTNVNLYARATEHIHEIISQIQRLVGVRLRLRDGDGRLLRRIQVRGLRKAVASDFGGGRTAQDRARYNQEEPRRFLFMEETRRRS